MRTNNVSLSKKIVTMGLIWSSLMQVNLAIAADTQVATLIISGNVPVVFNLTIRGMPGELDFNPGATVVGRTLAALHFRINEDIAHFYVQSTTAAGAPSKNLAQPAFLTSWVTTIGACNAILPGAFVLGAAGAAGKQDLKPASALTQGYDEDCLLTGDWTTDPNVPGMGGLYTSTYTFTMISA